MPLKRNNIERKSAVVEEGSPIRTPEGKLMSLFKPAMLPLVTLNTRQFIFPKSFLVTDAKRVPEYLKNPETGWDLKDDQGNKTQTGKYFVRLQVTDGDVAQDLVDKGLDLSSLSSIQCTIQKDIPLQSFEPNSTLIKLVKPVVMLGFGGQQADRILLVADDCELV